jgi:glyoxylase-like metal-dependent hydrolase (beta-lactamase superfamily II)
MLFCRVRRLPAASLLACAGALALQAGAEPQPAPLPVQATEVPPGEVASPPPVTLEVIELRGGFQVLRGGGGNAALWSGPDGVVLVDDKLDSVTPELLATVNRIAPGGIRFVINTHWHFDHTGANEPIGRAGGVIIAHENVRSRMSAGQFIEAVQRTVPAADPAALPVVTFADAVSMHLNGDRLDVVHLAEAHTDGDAVLWWRNANIVHVGDIFFNGSYPFIDTSSGGSLAGLVAAVEIVLARVDEETIVIPGHGPIANRADLEAYRDMVVEIGRRVREMIEQGHTLDEVLAAKPTAAYDERNSSSFMPPEKFIGILYGDLSGSDRAR